MHIDDYALEVNPRELMSVNALSSTNHTMRLADSVSRFDSCVCTCLPQVNSALILEISIRVWISVGCKMTLAAWEAPN